ncbi:MAG: glutamate 5-kinase [Candidatus Omnitrophota bacterium]|nr:glutamate 5-kinase [Candidatus Omnitrophota bacterium]
MTRTFNRPIRRVVVKLGSSQIADYALKPRTAQLRSLASQVGRLRKRGIEVVLVSSGAIVLGMGELGEKKRPTELASLQARAAIGQAVLMRTYSKLFEKAGLKCAQVLLTWDDFKARVRFLNSRHTLDNLLKEGVIPVINENDTTSTEEIRFGDNDKLSALVAGLVRADLLLILSDVSGLYGADKKVFEEVKEITAQIERLGGGTRNFHIARGGMKTKIEAVKIATHAGVPCVITAGHIRDVLTRVVDGQKIGTYFIEKNDKIFDGDMEHEFIRSHFKNRASR